MEDMIKVRDHIKQNYSKMRLLLPVIPQSDFATNALEDSKFLSVRSQNDPSIFGPGQSEISAIAVVNQKPPPPAM